MYKGINNSKIVACMLALGFMSVGTSCTDNDYDLSNIDFTVGLGGDGLQLPASSTENIVLNDVLDFNNSDFITIAENGDYMFRKEGENVNPAHLNVNKVVVQKASINSGFKVEVPVSVLSQLKRKTLRSPKLSTPVTAEGKTSEFHYHSAASCDIRELVSAKVSSDVTIHVNVSEELKKVVHTFTTMTLTLPPYMKLNVGNCSPSKPDYDAVNGIVTFHNVSSSADIYLHATVDKLDFTSKMTAENSLKLTPGVNGANGSVDLNGEVRMGITFDEVFINGNSTSNLCLSSKMTMSPITISEATGKFDPKIDLNNLGRVDINDVPDFLTDDDVKVNLYNPIIEFTVKSDIGVSALVAGNLVAEDAQGNKMAQVAIPQMTIKHNAVTHICICKRREGIDASKYDEVKVVPNLSDIVAKIPNHIRFVADAHADAARQCTVALGRKYNIESEYSMSAPLAFDKGAQIVYTDTIDGWNDDIDKFSFAEGSYIEMTTEFVNKMPVYLKVNAYAIDVEGNEIAQNRVRVDVSNSVKASEDGVTAATTPLTIKLHETEKGALKKVDGIVFRIVAASEDEGSKAIVGKTINAHKQTLIARNIKVKLVGKIIADFN